MGGGGFLGLGPAPSAPAAPDYSAAARETATGNLDAARAATAANRVNQVTPYGRLDYSITGQDPYGNPTWTATQSLSPQQQQLLDYQNQTSMGLGRLAGQGLGYVENMLQTPFDTSKLPSTGFNPSQTYQDAYMQRLQPQITQNREALQQQLANKGIDIGSTAYDRAMQTQAQRENDLLAAATTQGFGVGQQARQQALTNRLICVTNHLTLYLRCVLVHRLQAHNLLILHNKQLQVALIYWVLLVCNTTLKWVTLIKNKPHNRTLTKV